MRYCPECNREIERWKEVDDGWICYECQHFVEKDAYCYRCEKVIIQDPDEMCGECSQEQAEMRMER